MSFHGVVGSQPYTSRVTTYYRYLILEAIDLDAYRQSQSIEQVWKTTIISSGRSGNLRRVFPVLVGAASDHIGTNTGKQVLIKISEDDPRVHRIKGGQ